MSGVSTGSEAREAFVAAYLRLCEQHGLYVESCGCCDGPWLMSVAEVAEEKPESFAEALRSHGEHLLEDRT